MPVSTRAGPVTRGGGRLVPKPGDLAETGASKPVTFTEKGRRRKITKREMVIK
jgi:hypothetical protein